jgi:broad specificity phosphatase PhoE
VEVTAPPVMFEGPRSYLFVSAGEPAAAAEAVAEWTDGPPDVCVTSPSARARETAAFASAGHYVDTITEPLLAGRGPAESGADVAARYAEALRNLYALKTRAALVVFDDPLAEGKPFVLDGDALVERAESLERRLPSP